MNIGDKVVLNKAGISCYNRNKFWKNIKPEQTMTIVKYHGFDSGREIYEVEYDGETDVYFQYCLNIK
jgi:hypothetical protein